MVRLAGILFNMFVSVLVQQPCNKSDGPIKLIASCLQLVLNLFQQLATSAANTTL